MKSRDITGVRFGNLVALVALGRSMHGSKVWRFRCDCGNEIERASGNVKAGHISSCGCMKKGTPAQHGMAGSSLYSRWINMRRRCENPDNENFENYGGRGIKVCARWQKFENFYVDMGDLPFEDAQIDRENNDGDYEPTNCRWSTPSENSNNRSNNVLVEIDGRTQTLMEWSSESGVPYATIWARLNRNWSAKKAVFQPARSPNG